MLVLTDPPRATKCRRWGRPSEKDQESGEDLFIEASRDLRSRAEDENILQETTIPRAPTRSQRIPGAPQIASWNIFGAGRRTDRSE